MKCQDRQVTLFQQVGHSGATEFYEPK